MKPNKVTFDEVELARSVWGRQDELQSYIKLSEFRRIWPSLNMNCLLLQSGELILSDRKILNWYHSHPIPWLIERIFPGMQSVFVLSVQCI